jgi:Leucine-rich repeat (LRR) protein
MKETIIYIICFFFTLFTIHAQNVNIPDTNFKKALIELGIDKNKDGEIQTSEAVMVDSLNVSNNKIEDLTGIEAFTNLLFLNCSMNSLSVIDFSNNSVLKTIYCGWNNLKTININKNSELFSLFCTDNSLQSIDISNNYNLKFFACDKNQLSAINVSNNKLTIFWCGYNKLEYIDISKNTELVDFRCSHNQITALDLRNNKELHFLHCGDNPKLKNICITKAQLKLTITDDIENYWWTKDESASWLTDCD